MHETFTHIFLDGPIAALSDIFLGLSFGFQVLLLGTVNCLSVLGKGPRFGRRGTMSRNSSRPLFFGFFGRLTTMLSTFN